MAGDGHGTGTYSIASPAALCPIRRRYRHRAAQGALVVAPADGAVLEAALALK
jgi:hypothetical protein